MANVRELFGTPWADADRVNLSTFDVGSIGSAPATTATGGTIETKERDEFEKLQTDPWQPNDTINKVLNNTQTVTKEAVNNTTAMKELNAVKTLANEVLNDREIINDVSDDFWQDLANGKVSADALMKHKGISGLVNTLTGSNCMSTDLEDFFKDFLDNLLDQGWDLGDPKFFECMLENFKNMGTDFINNVSRNASTIIKEPSLSALKGVGDVLGQQAKDLLPNHTDSLATYAGSLTGDELVSVFDTIDPNWTSDRTGNLDLDVFSNANDTAKSTLAEVDDSDALFGLTLADTFDVTAASPNPVTFSAPTFSDLRF